MENLFQWDRVALLNSAIFEPLHLALQSLNSAHFPDVSMLNAILLARPAIFTQSGKPLRFVDQATGKLVFEAQYEPRCYLTGEVQTRENNLHDLFNALVWLTFPQSKAAINARHYRALIADAPLFPQAREGQKSQRGSTRDMATLFDESGVVVAYADETLAQLLCDFKWKELFWQRRTEVSAAMGFYIAGHGLYEKAVQSYVGITGQGLLVRVETAFFSWTLAQRLQHLDERVAAYLHQSLNCQDTRELTPVPLLGIPGWSVANECAEFYDNQRYFRPGRLKEK